MNFSRQEKKAIMDEFRSHMKSLVDTDQYEEFVGFINDFPDTAMKEEEIDAIWYGMQLELMCERSGVNFSAGRWVI